ncbi:transcriptional regulator [Nocardiopsis sp. FIRDI 009]|uniref:transcriptional regulator n=1 Tax=Nocardiopsis sp. FIRDI 009 TaxID=714197 RepID=UPI000E235B75|nr:transcriptional regulator [Nocardiopsis sp. FIRDI 009]
MYAPHIRRSAVDMLNSGIFYSEVSRRLGINRSTLRAWRTDPSSVDKHQDSACPRCEPIPRPPADAESYSYLLGLYLGDGCISRTGDGSRGVHRLRILCSDSWPGLIEQCSSSMASVHPGRRVNTALCTGCTEVYGDWKHWPCLFPQHGPGKKHHRTIALEPWQQQIVDAHREALVRGLIHSDGCRVTNRIRKKLPDGGEKWYEYPRYHFTNASRDIVNLLTATLDRLDIPWRSHVKATTGVHDQTVVSISTKAAVARMDSFVGPKY